MANRIIGWVRYLMPTVPLPNEVEIQPIGRLNARVRPPGSKSYTNRALVVAALAEGTSTLAGALDSQDTQLMMEGLRRLGVAVDHDPANRQVRVAGCGGRIPSQQADLYVGNAGTTARFLTALVTLGSGTYRLDGNPRMRERPIEPLLQALRQLGADCESEQGTGCPPVRVRGRELQGGQVQLRGDVSSQFLSALLMVAPYARKDVVVEVEGPLVSRPYVEMTIEVMNRFGVGVDWSPADRLRVQAPQSYRGTDYEVEPDASAASYFFAAAAITGGTVTVEGLSHRSLQGDVRFVELLREMGCQVDYGEHSISVTGQPLQGISASMTDISDTVPTLAVVAMFARSETTITGVAHIRRKETDRLTALVKELAKFGAEVSERPDGLVIQPPKGSIGSGSEQDASRFVIETYDDHRMAMSFALVGLRVPGVVILDPGCTAKTYPGFFDELAQFGAVR